MVISKQKLSIVVGGSLIGYYINDLMFFSEYISSMWMAVFIMWVILLLISVFSRGKIKFYFLLYFIVGFLFGGLILPYIVSNLYYYCFRYLQL